MDNAAQATAILRRTRARRLLPALCVLVLLSWWSGARAQESTEYRIKAAFLYNFARFTDWPTAVPDVLHLCVYGEDPFDEALDDLVGKRIGQRKLVVQHKSIGDSLLPCQLVFIAPRAMRSLPRVLDSLRGTAVLTVADSPGACQKGVMLNMAVVQGKVRFEANLQAAHAAQLRLSSQLLRLATEVIQ